MSPHDDDTVLDDPGALADDGNETRVNRRPVHHSFKNNAALVKQVWTRRGGLNPDHGANPFFIGNSMASGPKPPSWALDEQKAETPGEEESIETYYETPEDYMLDIHFNVLEPGWRHVIKARRNLYRRALHDAFKRLKLPPLQYAVSLSFVNDAESRRLNAEYRHKDKATNVLSFPQIEDFSALDDFQQPVELGDIVLAYETIAAEAARQHKQIEHHLTHLLVHGLLHLCGYDHLTPKEAKAMEALEISVLAQLGIADPYMQ